MTDSMKFGPEWLRNMSADNTNISLTSNVSNAAVSSSLPISGSSSNDNACTHQSFGVTSYAPSQQAYNSGPRNTFPEFRYGREEMLSLFDKYHNTPEILPKFKKIFVDKVQLPLALTPTTEEDLSHTTLVQNQRASWIQRSPVGFNNPTRGPGRGGSVDRGRMRGKSNYHHIYQRPTTLFDEDDSRSAQLKIDRGWSDRNGTGETLNVSGGSMCGLGLHTDWNDTPSSSPRKEFSSHPRNMENWRRNRSEDGSGDSLANCVGNTDGWRGSNNMGNNFTGNHRWGRATSWRDEDAQSGSTNDTGYGSNLTMQRAYSTITTVNERGCMTIPSGSNATKTTSNTYGGSTCPSSSRTFSSLSILNSPSVRKAQWNVNIGNTSTAENDDILPEWAMEYPSDGGGTFDASGAFHRCVEETGSSNVDSTSESKKDFKADNPIKNKTANNLRDKECEDSAEQADACMLCDLNKNNSALCTPIEELAKNTIQKSHLDTSIPNVVCTTAEELGTKTTGYVQRNVESKLKMCTKEEILQPIEIPPHTVSYKPSDNSFAERHLGNVQRDLSESMQKVADDMIEKLIMDDDTIITNNNKRRNERNSEQMIQSATMNPPVQVGNRVDDNNVFMTVSAISPHNSKIQGPASVSPTTASTVTDDGVHKGMQLYGGGLVAESAMHHHNIKQPQFVPASVTNLTPIGSLAHGIHTASLKAAKTDLWYYRDPQSEVQGPFSAIEMTEWYRAGYFNGNLYVRRLCDTHFRSLGELIKLCNDNMPFTHSHLLPNLDNLDLLDNAIATAKQPQSPISVADYGVVIQTPQPVDQSDLLKGNKRTEEAFLGNNGNGQMLPVDVSSMYFQMMPHQEILIYNELSASECFQQLTSLEKDAVLRQKLQIRADYLRNLALASINPPVGASPLFDDIIDGSKKDNIFSNSKNTGSLNAAHLPETNTYIDTEDFQMNSPPCKQPILTEFSGNSFGTIIPPGETANNGKFDGVNADSVGTELLDSLGMRTLMSTSNTNPRLNTNRIEFIRDPCGGFLNDADFIVARTSSDQSNLHGNSWLPQAVNRQSIISHQSSSEWSNDMLGGIPVSAVSSLSSASVNANLHMESPQQQKTAQKQKIISTDLWKLSMLEQPLGEKIKQEALENTTNIEAMSLTIQNISSNGEHTITFDKPGFQSGDSNLTAAEKMVDSTIQSRQPSSLVAVTPATSTTTIQYKDEPAEQHHNANTKRAIKLQPLPNKVTKECDDNTKKSPEDQRRDQVEDKRRNRQEKKRQQADEEKRRQQKTDEDKRRSTKEEKHNQQIQGQRRKAVIGGASNNSPVRVQSSIAPWSSQVNVVATGGPSLAEIQRAERRERQIEQRQVDTLVKKVRSGAIATVEVYDPMLKWNAPLKEVPVKSFAEIQAEEARRLIEEHTELQRRKEQEQLQVVAAMTTISSSGASNISAIWGGTKAWGSTSATGFWEEPTKLSTDITSNTGAIEPDSITSKVSSSCSPNISNNAVQQKVPQSMGKCFSKTGHITNQSQPPNSRNLRKSQTLPVMQNAGQQTGKTSKSNTSKQDHCNQPQHICGGNNIDVSAGTDKKGSARNQFNNPAACRTSINKKDDYENEFVVWCTKSLSNMNTKLDGKNLVLKSNSCWPNIINRLRLCVKLASSFIGL